MKQRKVITIIILVIFCSVLFISIYNQVFIADKVNQNSLSGYSFITHDNSNDGRQYSLILLLLITLLGLFIIMSIIGYGKNIRELYDFILTRIYNGIIPGNFFYQQIFKAANINLQIFSRDFSSVYKAGGATPIDMKIKKLIAEKEIIKDFPINDHLLLSAQPITGGYAVWQKDINNLRQLKEVLAITSYQISDGNEVLENENKIQGRYWEMKWQNSICEELETAITNEMAAVHELLNKLPRIEKNDNFSYTKYEITKLNLLICYIKRKSNLLLSGRQNGMLLIADLAQSCSEMLKIAEAAGIESATNIPPAGKMSLESALLFYDFFHQLLEKLMIYMESYIFWQIVLSDKIIKLVIFADLSSEGPLSLENITLSEKLSNQIKSAGGIFKAEIEDEQYNLILELLRGRNIDE